MSLADSLIAGVNAGRPTQHLVKMVNPAHRVVDHLGDDNQHLHGIGDVLANGNPGYPGLLASALCHGFPEGRECQHLANSQFHLRSAT